MGNAAGFSRLHRALFAFIALGASPLLAAECPAVGDIAFDPTARAFAQTRTLPSLPNPISSAGVLQARDDGFVWQICEPFDIRTVIDDDGIRQSVEGGEETSPGPAIVQDTIRRISIADIFRGRFSELESTFATNITPAQTGDKNWQVALTPHDTAIGAVIEQIAVSGCQMIETVRITYRDGGRDDIVVGQALPDNQGATCQNK